MDTKAHVPRAILRIAISAWPLPDYRRPTDGGSKSAPVHHQQGYGRDRTLHPLGKIPIAHRAEGHDMTQQEYLDRQDEYNMTFFLDENMKWINTSIIINDWVVRFNEMDM